MSTPIGPEQVVERPRTPDELVATIALAMLEGVNANLELQAQSARLDFEIFAAQARYEAEAWGKMMKTLRERGAI